MEGYQKVFRLVLPILFIAFLFLGIFFWAGTPLLKITDESYHELKIPTPVPRTSGNQPIISASGALLMDMTAHAIHFSKNANLRFSPASATKIMTAYVVLTHYKLNEVFTVDEETIPGSRMGLLPGEKISVESLLYGLLLNSGNDAAYILAKNYKGGVEGFVDEMNRVAIRLGLKNTHFVDPAGLSDDGNFMTTLDLANLAEAVVENEIFAKIVATREKTVFDITGRIGYQLQNLNRLLWDVPGVVGVKTGFTQRSGGVLIALIKRQNTQLLTVVFKSDDRFLDTKNLIDWYFQQKRE